MVRRASQHRDDAVDDRMAAADLESRHQGAGIATVGIRRGGFGRGSGAAGARRTGDARDRGDTPHEPRSPGPLPLHHAGAVERSGDARLVLREPEGRQEPRARSVGARRDAVSQSPAPRRGVEEYIVRTRSDSSTRFSARATSSFPSAGRTTRSAGISRCRRPRRCARSSITCQATIRRGCGGCCCRPRIRCFGRRRFSIAKIRAIARPRRTSI